MQIRNLIKEIIHFLCHYFKTMEEKEKCTHCGSTDDSVSYRPNAYAQDVGNDSTAYHTVCDECDYQNRMDI